MSDVNENLACILASVSFWPLLIIGSLASVSQHVLVLFTHDLLVNKYNVKCELDCFNCKTGVFLRLFTLMFTQGSNYNTRFSEKNQIVYGEYLTIIRKN